MLTAIGEDRKKFVVGKEYWTFYMETTNRGDKLRNVVPVFKTVLLSKMPSQYQTCGFYLKFSPPDKKTNTNITTYMNGYGSAQCVFFDIEDEAKIAFDNRLKQIASIQKASDRDLMYKKLYNKVQPAMGIIEEDAKKWKLSLGEKELQYLDWFIHNS